MFSKEGKQIRIFFSFLLYNAPCSIISTISGSIMFGEVIQ